MVIHKAYRFRLRPSKAQESLFRQFAGCRRFAWNKALGISGFRKTVSGQESGRSPTTGWRQISRHGSGNTRSLRNLRPRLFSRF